jgi:hypothetical protein
MAGSKLDPFEDVVRGLVAQGFNNTQIAARFDGVSRHAVQRFKAAKGIGTPVSPVTFSESSPDDGVTELEMLRQENAELRKQARAGREEDVKLERVCLTIAEHLDQKEPRYKPAAYKNRHKKHEHSLVLLWSDQHAAEVVSLEETNGANEYNWEIMLKRHDELRRGVLSWAEQFSPVKELVILGLGDSLSGNIHDELAETNEMPMAEATVQFGLDGAEFIESFAEHFPLVRFAGVVGNHPRAHRKPRAKQKYDNADWVAYQVMKQRLARYSTIEFDIPKAQKHPVMVQGRRILATHGDGIRSTMVDVPWGGIIRLTNKLRNQYAQLGLPIDHFALGHYHEANVVKNRRILMNGSVKGVDEFSLSAFGGGEPPTQLLVPFHPRWGMVGAQYIDLDGQAG